MNIKQIQLDTTDSTNHYILHVPLQENELVSVSALFQTRGHGQKGNFWEAEYGKNLLISIAFRASCVPVDRQFILSQALSLSIFDTLCQYIPHKENIYIKWPNDIYYNNKKICGFLVSCDLEGMQIGRCIAGIGLNINQETFRSDAPNPVSLKQIIHDETPLNNVQQVLIRHIIHYYTLIKSNNFQIIEQDYFKHLYHKEGFHFYRDKDGIFSARITNINHQGILYLRDTEGKERCYAFKEVEQLITNPE